MIMLGLQLEEFDRMVRFRLTLEGSTVYLLACDEAGRNIGGGYLLGFMPDGTIQRQAGFNNSVGIQVDSNGQIVEEEDS